MLRHTDQRYEVHRPDETSPTFEYIANLREEKEDRSATDDRKSCFTAAGHRDSPPRSGTGRDEDVIRPDSRCTPPLPQRSVALADGGRFTTASQSDDPPPHIPDDQTADYVADSSIPLFV